MENIDFNPSKKSWKKQKEAAAAKPGQFEGGIELPPDEGGEMEIMGREESLKEFDPTLQGETTGAYTGERVKGQQEIGTQYAEDITQWSELEKQRFMDQIKNPEGATAQEKVRHLKDLYATFIRQAFERRNVDVKFRELAREALKELGLEGITTIPMYIKWLKKNAEQGKITQEQMAERRKAAHEDLAYLEDYYKEHNPELYMRASEVSERIKKNSI